MRFMSYFGGSTLLQRGELNFSSAKKHAVLKWALAQGFRPPMEQLICAASHDDSLVGSFARKLD